MPKPSATSPAITSSSSVSVTILGTAFSRRNISSMTLRIPEVCVKIDGADMDAVSASRTPGIYGKRVILGNNDDKLLFLDGNGR